MEHADVKITQEWGMHKPGNKYMNTQKKINSHGMQRNIHNSEACIDQVII